MSIAVFSLYGILLTRFRSFGLFPYDLEVITQILFLDRLQKNALCVLRKYALRGKTWNFALSWLMLDKKQKNFKAFIFTQNRIKWAKNISCYCHFKKQNSLFIIYFTIASVIGVDCILLTCMSRPHICNAKSLSSWYIIELLIRTTS
jgi:hypothetical protein